MKIIARPNIKKQRNDRIKRLYGNGYSTSSIAKFFGISYQRTRQIITGYSSNAQFSFAKYPHLTTQKECECGKKATDIHHIDGNSKNNDPENLVKLCRSCHIKKHPRGKRTNSRIYSGQL